MEDFKQIAAEWAKEQLKDHDFTEHDKLLRDYMLFGSTFYIDGRRVTFAEYQEKLSECPPNSLTKVEHLNVSEIIEGIS